MSVAKPPCDEDILDKNQSLNVSLKHVNFVFYKALKMCMLRPLQRNPAC
jgi:hypothetical protein